MIESMKSFWQAVRISIASLAVTLLLVGGLGSPTLASPANHSVVFVNAEKHVQIKVEIHGDIDGHTVESVEHLVMEWLEAAHFVVSHTDSADTLHLHVLLEVKDNHHFEVHSDCGGWAEDKEAAVVDAIDEILHHMINDFIDKYGH
jgi:hypothetical protein